MSERRRLTDPDVAGTWYTLEHNESPGLLRVAREALRADHLQAREDVKRLAAKMTDAGARLMVKVKVADGESFAELMLIIDEMRTLLREVDPE